MKAETEGRDMRMRRRYTNGSVLFLVLLPRGRQRMGGGRRVQAPAAQDVAAAQQEQLELRRLDELAEAAAGAVGLDPEVHRLIRLRVDHARCAPAGMLRPCR